MGSAMCHELLGTKRIHEKEARSVTTSHSLKATAFNGWYMSTEIVSDLFDINRYNLLNMSMLYKY